MVTYYSEEHEWLMIDDDIAIIGITAHAAEQLGDIVFIEQKEPGDEFENGDEIGVIESVKAASEIYAPVDGEVVEANEVLQKRVLTPRQFTRHIIHTRRWYHCSVPLACRVQRGQHRQAHL